jgi:Na+/melibiose symporter and related transporters
MAKDKTKNLNRPLSVGEIATYSLGSLGREFSNNCVNAFFLVFLCIYQGLNPIIMTISFVLAKLWDAANDPMLATMVNNGKKSRFGRYRPWILGGAVVNALTLVLMFLPLPNAGIGMKYFYYIFMYILWGMSFTVMDVPFWSMLPTIANTTEERNKASSLAKLIGGLGGFLVGMVGTSIILPNVTPASNAYMVLGLVSGGIMIVFVLFTVIGNREKYVVPHENVGIKQIITMFKENDQLRAYALCLLFFLIGTSISLSQVLYLYIYCYESGADLLPASYSYTMFWVIACTGQGIAMFFYNWLTKKFPREKIFGLSFLACVVSYILLFFVFFILKPGNYVLNTILVALSGAFLMTASGLNQIGSTVMIADVVDYGEYKTGKRGDSVIFSVQTLIMKFAGALSALVLGIGISVSGLPTISELPVNKLENATYVKIAETTVTVEKDMDGNVVKYWFTDLDDYYAAIDSWYNPDMLQFATQADLDKAIEKNSNKKANKQNSFVSEPLDLYEVTGGTKTYLKSVNVYTFNEDTEGKAFAVKADKSKDVYRIKSSQDYAAIRQSYPDANAEFVGSGTGSSLISLKSLTKLRVFMFLIPIPLAIIGYIAYKKKYWLFGEKYDEIKKEIDRRRREKGFDEFGNPLSSSDADDEPESIAEAE